MAKVLVDPLFHEETLFEVDSDSVITQWYFDFLVEKCCGLFLRPACSLESWMRLKNELDKLQGKI